MPWGAWVQVTGAQPPFGSPRDDDPVAITHVEEMEVGTQAAAWKVLPD